MKIKTNVNAGGVKLNHNHGGLAVKSAAKAGGMSLNHSQGVAVKSNVKAGGRRSPSLEQQ